MHPVEDLLAEFKALVDQLVAGRALSSRPYKASRAQAVSSTGGSLFGDWAVAHAAGVTGLDYNLSTRQAFKSRMDRFVSVVVQAIANT